MTGIAKGCNAYEFKVFITMVGKILHSSFCLGNFVLLHFKIKLII